MRVVVTGASGFVGSAVVQDLAERGHEVIACGRRRPDRMRQDVWFMRWDLRGGSLTGRDHPGDADAVVHCAVAPDGASPALAWLVNMEGTRSVRATFPKARFVQVAAVKASGPAAEAERWLQKDAAEPDRGPVVLLRPGVLYGPGDRTVLPWLESLVVAGRWLPLPGGGEASQHVTHVDTLAAAVNGALDADIAAEIAAGEPLVAHVADAEPVRLRQILELLMLARGRHVQVIPVPERTAHSIARLSERAASLLRRKSRLTLDALDHLTTERTYDLTVLRERLGVDPPETSVLGAGFW